ncbi:MAG: low molecular weight protein-tyrosine-phosphatase [Casimicrobiaceae bacterium]
MRIDADHSFSQCVLFVCMGNICRSPTAEVVFRHVARRDGVLDQMTIDSAGIGDWHVGDPPDARSTAHARRRGYDLSVLRGRQVNSQDFERFGWILAMDRRNLRDLARLKPDGYRGNIGLLLDFAAHLGVREVPDPYYGAAEGFEGVLDLIEPACESLLMRVRAAATNTG